MTQRSTCGWRGRISSGVRNGAIRIRKRCRRRANWACLRAARSPVIHTLTARTLITAIGTVEYPVIEVDSAGLITDISSDPSIRSEAVLTPTFLDVHIHGAAGHDV